MQKQSFGTTALTAPSLPEPKGLMIFHLRSKVFNYHLIFQTRSKYFCIFEVYSSSQVKLKSNPNTLFIHFEKCHIKVAINMYSKYEVLRSDRKRSIASLKTVVLTKILHMFFEYMELPLSPDLSKHYYNHCCHINALVVFSNMAVE